jgi:hypothetical protein
MLLFKSALFGLSWGLLQGMVMFPGGVRLHNSFGWYHTCLAVMIFSFTSLLWTLRDYRARWRNIALFIGVLILIWECSEVGYRLARYDIAGWYEHICFFDSISLYITGYKVALLHLARGITSLLVIWRYK